jgi:hypothetical protein
MVDGQLDTLDLQAKISTGKIITNIEKGLESALAITYTDK